MTSEQSESKISTTIPFTIKSKRIKGLGVNLTKRKVQQLYTESHKTLLQENKDVHGQKDSLQLRRQFFPH